MLILLLNIIIAVLAPALAIWTIYRQQKGKIIFNYLIIINIILLALSVFLNPYSLISAYIEQTQQEIKNKEIKSELLDTKIQLNSYLYAIRQLSVNLDIAYFPKRKPKIDDFIVIGERNIFLSDSKKNLYQLHQSTYSNLADFQPVLKWFVSSGKFELLDNSKLKGKSINKLDSINTLKIPIKDFVVGKIRDTIGIRLSININDMNFYKFPVIKHNNFYKIGIQGLNDTIKFDLTNIFKNTEKKVDSLFKKIKTIK